MGVLSFDVKLVTASLVTRYKIAATAAYEVRGLNPAPRESFTHRLKAVGYLSILYKIIHILSYECNDKTYKSFESSNHMKIL